MSEQCVIVQNTYGFSNGSQVYDINRSLLRKSHLRHYDMMKKSHVYRNTIKINFLERKRIMKKVVYISLIFSFFVSGILLSGCESCKETAEPTQAPEKVEKKQEPLSPCGPHTISMNYPYGDSPVIRLDKVMPKNVPLSASFDYSIKVTNLTNVMVRDIVVTEYISENFKYVDSIPAAKKEANKLVWTLDSLDPEASREIKVVGMAASRDCLQHCATVTYVIATCSNIQVVEPKLKLTKTAPKNVSFCDTITETFVVTNSGSGVAKDVKIVETLPEGLKTEDGKSEITLVAGTLAAGQSEEFSVKLKPTKTGKYINKAVASSSGGLKVEVTTTTTVRQPVLTIAKEGPKKIYLGRVVRYKITVKNTGDAQAPNTIVKDIVPQGVTDIRASGNGELMRSVITWQLGTLAPNSSKTVTVTYKPDNIGTISNKATALANCADAVRASASTSVVGIPAILLEVVDVEDPIEVGSQTTYVITATNQGSAAGTKIRIVCTLEDNEQYVSSSGPTTGTLKDDTLTFAPMARLAPKAKATWRVVVKAVKPGKVLFKVSMTSEEFSRSVEETESTNLYE